VIALKDKILTSGDSWTAGSSGFNIETGKAVSNSLIDYENKTVFNPMFPLWSEIIADKMNMDYINLGCGGRGNQWIYDRVVDNWDGEKIVMVLWSAFDRWDFCRETISMSLIRGRKDSSGRPQKGYRIKVFDALNEAELVDTWYDIQKSMRIIHAFQNFCEVNNIQYIHAIPFHPILIGAGSGNLDLYNKTLKKFIELKSLNYIKEDHFIGFPIFPEIGGFTMSDKLNEIDPEKKLRVDAPKDNHPNHEGHKVIADIYYERYKKLYKS
jgi:hypothetical protein